MKKQCFYLLVFFSSIPLFSQSSLNNYSYVIVPDQFEFQSSKDQYQLNSMAEFLFDKYGFNAYLSGQTPNANRCDGLYAEVTKEWAVLRTKLKIVLKDCNGAEIYASEIGDSKYKEYSKAYQDALRETFKSIARLNVDQKDVVILEGKTNSDKAVSNYENDAVVETTVSSGNTAKASEFSKYFNDGNSYLLQKTTEGYSLFEESESADSPLILKGKVVIIGSATKFMDSSGNVFDAHFDASGNLTIQNGGVKMVYKAEN